MYEGIGRSLGTDYFRIGDQLTREELDYWRRTRDFVDDRVLPVINDYWERAEFPWPLVEEMGKLGIVGDGIVVWARDTADRQVKGFLVEKGAAGFEPRRIDGKGSLRAVWQAEITLTDVRVPEERRLPGANSFKDTARVLAGTRNAVAWGA